MFHVRGDITTAASGVIIHQVNAQGVMGSGVAKTLRDKWPVVFKSYTELAGPAYCQPNMGRDLLGRISAVEVEPGLHVVNLVGQQFFGKDGRRYTSYDALDVGLEATAAMFPDATFHHPQLGCGLGGGQWEVVELLIKLRLGNLTTLWLFP